MACPETAQIRRTLRRLASRRRRRSKSSDGAPPPNAWETHVMTRIDRQLLEKLAKELVATNSVSLVAKVETNAIAHSLCIIFIPQRLSP